MDGRGKRPGLPVFPNEAAERRPLRFKEAIYEIVEPDLRRSLQVLYNGYHAHSSSGTGSS